MAAAKEAEEMVAAEAEFHIFGGFVVLCAVLVWRKVGPSQRPILHRALGVGRRKHPVGGGGGWVCALVDLGKGGHLSP
jgi:hypothetical protein